jgi:hypothetical protein
MSSPPDDGRAVVRELSQRTKGVICTEPIIFKMPNGRSDIGKIERGGRARGCLPLLINHLFGMIYAQSIQTKDFALKSCLKWFFLNTLRKIVLEGTPAGASSIPSFIYNHH